VRPRSLAMFNHLFAVAVGVHQGVGADRHALEDALVVDRTRQVENGGEEPAPIDDYGAAGLGLFRLAANAEARSFVTITLPSSSS
jgi:hypothetical protein